MYRFAWIAKFFLLLVLPSLIFPMDYSLPMEEYHPTARSPFWDLSHPFSYDDVLELIDEIENGDLDHYTLEELDRINQFVALLATKGILPHEASYDIAVLNRDIHSLLGDDIGYSLDGNWFAASLTFDADILLCRSWAKKQWDQTRTFVKKHKKAIIIGAAVVVVGVTVVVLTCGTGTGAVAGAAGAALGGATLGTNDERQSNPILEEIPIVAVAPQTPLLQEIIEDKVICLKEMISENPAVLDEGSFVESVRDFGAYLAHETLESVYDVASQITELGREIKLVAEYVGIDLTSYHDVFPPRDLNASFYSGHEAIDRVFGVTQAPRYTAEAKAAAAESAIDFTYGLLPAPSLLSGIALAEGRLIATQCNATRGWAVGQPIQNRTWWGGTPTWSAVRQRYWKNEAEVAKLNPKHRYRTQIARMEKGLAPSRFNPITQEMESIELHHVPPQREGGLFDFIEVTAEEHARLDSSRRLGR